MKFIAFYIKDGQVEKEVIDSCALSLAKIQATINARRTDRKLDKVIYNDLYINIYKDLKNNDIDNLYKDIVFYSNDGKLIGENIEKMLNDNCISYTKQNKKDVLRITIKIKNNYAVLVFLYNSYGVLKLSHIVLNGIVKGY